MVQVDYCQTDDEFTCVCESFFSIALIVSFIVFGYYSYKETRGRTSYLREKYTTRHAFKLVLSGLLALISAVFVLVYIATEDEMSLKTVMTWSISSLLWALNALLIRKEYKSLGYTTNYLRYAWISMFACQSVLLVFEAAGDNTDNGKQVALIYALNEIFIFAIIIVGYSYADDYPPQKPEENYESLLNDSESIVNEEFFRNSLVMSVKDNDDNNASGEDNFKPFLTEDEKRQMSPTYNRSQDSLMNRTGGDSSRTSSPGLKTKKNVPTLGSRAAAQKAVPVSIRDDIHKIEMVFVSGYELIIRANKETVVYTVEFMIKGKKFSTKRSYNEFQELRTDLRKDKIAIELPELPGKKGIGKTRDDEALNERRETFDKMMKILITEKVGLGYLANFLQPTNILPYYGKHKHNRPENASVMTYPDDRRSLENNAKAKNYENGNGRNTIVPDYTNEDNRNRVGTMGNYFVVETIGVFDGVDNSKYYKMNLSNNETGQEVIISKRYNDFKNFHESLKKNCSGDDKKYIPELPYKGNVSAISSRDDPRVIEYRKVALRSYLQNILNSTRFQMNSVVINFIRPSNS